MAQTATMKATNVAAMMGIDVNPTATPRICTLADLTPQGLTPEQWINELVTDSAKQLGATVNESISADQAGVWFKYAQEQTPGLSTMTFDEQRTTLDKALRQLIANSAHNAWSELQHPGATAVTPIDATPQTAAPAAPTPAPAAPALAPTATATDYAIPTDPIGAKYHGRFQQSLKQLGTDGIVYTWTERPTEKSTKVTMTAVIDGEDTLTIEYDVTHHSKNVTFESDGKTYALKSEGAFWNCMTGKDDIAKYEKKTKTAKTAAPTPAPAAPAPEPIAETPAPVAETPTAIYTPTADEQFFTAVFEGTRITIGLKQLQSGMIAIRNRAVGEDIWSYEEESLTETLDMLTGIAATPIDAPQDETPAPQDATPAPQDEDVPTSTESAPVSNEPQTAAPATDPVPVAGDTAKTYTQAELDEAIAKALAEQKAQFDKLMKQKEAEWDKALTEAHQSGNARVESAVRATINDIQGYLKSIKQGA